MGFRERRHRLPIELYKCRIRATFTICSKDKAYLFINAEVVNAFIENLKISNEKYQILNWCYIFMPEHIHILNEGKTETSDLWRGMRLFKQYCGYWLLENRIGIELQKDYYDHIHRKDEDLIKHIRYLLDNPVRKRLVTHWRDYSFKGSLDYNLIEVVR